MRDAITTYVKKVREWPIIAVANETGHEEESH